MHKDNHQSPVAVSYAKAVLELAHEQGKVADVAEELKQLRQLVDTVPMLREVMTDPAIGVTERQALFKRVFTGQLQPLLLDLLMLLTEKSRLDILPAIAGAFDDLLRAEQGFVDIDITVARELDPDQLQRVQAGVGNALHKQAVVHQFTDDSIIGGLVLRVQDQLIDGSTRTQLQNIRQRMLAARPR